MTVPNVDLIDGNAMPQLGFGVFQVGNDEAEHAVAAALESGYRSIDTASAYQNEEGVGRALRASGIPRDELFVTSKLWNSEQGYDNALRACDASLSRLGLDHLDLYLIHWPTPSRGLYLETWRALERLKQDGRVRSIGVSNFTIETLRRIVEAGPSRRSTRSSCTRTSSRTGCAPSTATTASTPRRGRRSGRGTASWTTRRSAASRGSTAAPRHRSCSAGTCRSGTSSSRSR